MYVILYIMVPFFILLLFLVVVCFFFSSNTVNCGLLKIDGCLHIDNIWLSGHERRLNNMFHNLAAFYIFITIDHQAYVYIEIDRYIFRSVLFFIFKIYKRTGFLKFICVRSVNSISTTLP